MKTTAIVITGFTGLVLLAGCVASSDSGYAHKRAEALARSRPLVYNTDGCDILYWPTNMPVSVEGFKNRRLKYALDSRISTVSYCPQSAGFGHFTCRMAGEPATGTVSVAHHGQASARNAAQDFFNLGTDALEMASEFCRSNNLELFVSIRMNDQHDGSSSPEKGYSALFPEFKKQHPECLMGAFGSRNEHMFRQGRGNWSCVNFAMPIVRDRVRQFVREFLENYDIDGIEFDFNRHLVLFKSVAEGGIASQEERDMMTELMRDIRKIAEEVGRCKNHPFVIVMRAPDSLSFNRDCGIDLERWFEEKLVDIWIGGGYFRLTPWEESVQLAHKHGVKFYASIDESRIERFCRNNALRCIPGRETIPAYAACFANAMAAGADGVYVFNREGQFLNNIAQLDGAKPEGEDKLYFVRYRGKGGYRPDHWLQDGFRHDKLPKLDPGRANEKDFPHYKPGERFAFTLTVGDDLNAPGAQEAKVAALALTNLKADGQLALTVNGHAVSACSAKDGLFRYELPRTLVRKGVNDFVVTFPDKGTDMTINDFALEIKYPKKDVIKQ